MIHVKSNHARVGDEITLEYVEAWEAYDVTTGETIDNPDQYPEELWNLRPAKSHTATYRVVACVTMRSSMSLRRYRDEEFILNSDVFINDSGTGDIMIYLFDTEKEMTASTGAYLKDYTEMINPDLDFESKNTYTDNFRSYQHMFLLVGSLLSAVIGLVGLLNFLNSVLTSILSRRREFAMLAAIGMTGRQLKRMLITEGILHAVLSVLLALGLSVLLNPLMEALFGDIFWFISYRFNLNAIFAALPVFLLLGILLPLITYHYCAKQTIVERLREIDG